MDGKAKAVKLLKKQPPMRRVLIALIPCVFGAVYYFGWRSLALIAAANIIGFVTEYIFCKKRGESVSEAVFVTSTLFALVMPPTISWHVLMIGVVFSVFFGKEVFGGFGRNIFNPAIAGRAFVYVCFPYALTGMWAPPADGNLGALKQWTTAPKIEAVTSATPMAHLKAGRFVPVTNEEDITSESIPYQVDEKASFKIAKQTFIKALAFGRISGTMGVTSALLITLGGIYLFITKTASRTIILSVIIAYAVFNMLFTLFGVPRFYGPILPVMGGGFLFGAFFMATDPVSSAKTEPGRIFYGIIIALGTTVIRNFSIFNGGLMFSILLGNMFAPIIDYAVKSVQQRGKAKLAGEDAK